MKIAVAKCVWFGFLKSCSVEHKLELKDSYFYSIMKLAYYRCQVLCSGYAATNVCV